MFSGQSHHSTPQHPPTDFIRTRIDFFDCHVHLDPLEQKPGTGGMRALRERDQYTRLYSELQRSGFVSYEDEEERTGSVIETLRPLHVGRSRRGQLWFEWLGTGHPRGNHQRAWERLFPVRLAPARKGIRGVDVKASLTAEGGFEVKTYLEGLVSPVGLSNHASFLVNRPHNLADLKQFVGRVTAERGLRMSIGGKHRNVNVSGLFGRLNPRLSRDLYGDSDVLSDSDIVIVLTVLQSASGVSLPWTGLPSGLREQMWEIVNSTKHDGEYMPRGAFERNVIRLDRRVDSPEYAYALIAPLGFLIWDQELWQPKRGFGQTVRALDAYHDQIWQSLLFARHLVGLRDGMAENGNDQEAARELEKQATKTLRRFVTHWKHPCNVIPTRFIDSLQGAGSQPWATH